MKSGTAEWNFITKNSNLHDWERSDVDSLKRFCENVGFMYMGYYKDSSIINSFYDSAEYLVYISGSKYNNRDVANRIIHVYLKLEEFFEKNPKTKTHSAFPSIATGMITGALTGHINDRIQKRQGHFIKRNRSAIFGTAIGGTVGGIVGSRRKENDSIQSLKLANNSIANAMKYKDKMNTEDFSKVISASKDVKSNHINKILKNTAITAGITGASIPVLHNLNKLDNNEQ